MKMRKYISSIFVAGLCTLGVVNLSFADDNNDVLVQDTLLSIEEQQKIWDEIDAKLANEKVTSDPKNPNARAGTYPTRKGVILVTNSLLQTSLVGHAGIVYNSNTTVESFAKPFSPTKNEGVYTYSNTWNKRYSKVYGMSVLKTTTAQDASAANWAYKQKGKPYSLDYTNIERTDKFYCSQLVYKAYKETTGKLLNYGGGIVYPMDLVKTSNTTQIYSK